MFSRAVRWPVLRRRATASGRFSSRKAAWRSRLSARSSRMASRSSAVASAALSSCPSAGAISSSGSPSKMMSPTPTRSSSTAPAIGAPTRCSIFIASMTTSGAPARTLWPAAAMQATIAPCSGAGTGIKPSGVGPAFRFGVAGSGAAAAPGRKTPSGSTPRRSRARLVFVPSPSRPDTDAAARSSPMRLSTKAVEIRSATKSRWSTIARRIGRFVSTPSTANSLRARRALRSASGSPSGEDAITLASRKS